MLVTVSLQCLTQCMKTYNNPLVVKLCLNKYWNTKTYISVYILMSFIFTAMDYEEI